MKRTAPLRRATPLRTTTGLRRSPMRRAAAMPDPVPEASRVAVAARSGGLCEVTVAEDCTGEAADFHHRQRRRLGDHSAANGLHPCRPCHRWVHAHPVESRACGWIVSAWADPSSVPVLIRGRWVDLAERVA